LEHSEFLSFNDYILSEVPLLKLQIALSAVLAIEQIIVLARGEVLKTQSLFEFERLWH